MLSTQTLHLANGLHEFSLHPGTPHISTCQFSWNKQNGNKLTSVIRFKREAVNCAIWMHIGWDIYWATCCSNTSILQYKLTFLDTGRWFCFGTVGGGCGGLIPQLLPVSALRQLLLSSDRNANWVVVVAQTLQAQELYRKVVTCCVQPTLDVETVVRWPTPPLVTVLLINVLDLVGGVRIQQGKESKARMNDGNMHLVHAWSE